jgi:hypothetical protein
MRKLTALFCLALFTTACHRVAPLAHKLERIRLGDTAGRAPTLYLTSAVLQSLQARAASGDAAWVTLKAKCDKLATGTMNSPTEDAYPDSGVGQGYQGSDYLAPMMNLGLCYRVTQTSDPTSAAKYATAGNALLNAVATPVASGGEDPSTDDGYGIRFFGTTMAIGYDWLYPALTATTKAAVITSLNLWIDWYDANGFSRTEPVGNYFVGYLLAKTTAAIATSGDNAKADGYWTDVQSHLWGTLAQPAFTAGVKGGGWPEGWEYGALSVREFAQFMLAVKTGKGIDLSASLGFVADEAAYATYFAWPSLKHVDDEGTIHSGTSMAPPGEMIGALAAMLDGAGNTYAPIARQFAQDVASTSSIALDEWEQFMFWDSSRPTMAYTAQAPSYVAKGPGQLAVRSTWDKTAVWAAFSSGPYIDAPDSGEQLYNQGGFSIVQGDQPIVCNATGWLPQVADTTGENYVYDDLSNGRRLANTFYVTDSANSNSPGQSAVAAPDSSAHLERYEEGGVFVRARGANIEGQYKAGVVTQYMRDFVYFRPGTFVVYDRTAVKTGSDDQWMSFHVPGTPTPASTADASQKRYDIIASGSTLGSIRTLLPKGSSPSVVALPPGHVWRLEDHASAAAQTWLHVITVGGTVPEQTRLSTADGNVLAGNMVGVHVQGTRNQVVLFAGDPAGTATTSAVKYVVKQTADADHVLTDMTPSATGYSVTATSANGALTIDVEPGGTYAVTGGGNLSFSVGASGTVQATAIPVLQSGTTTTPGGGTTTGTGTGSGSGTSATGGSEESTANTTRPALHAMGCAMGTGEGNGATVVLFGLVVAAGVLVRRRARD